jgi:dTDP-4-dehydrorhamnose reductase
MGKDIFLTGGSGLLALNWALHSRANENVVLGLHHRIVSINGTQSITIGLDSQDAVKRTIDSIRPELIIHTAGLTNVEICEKNPKLAQNVNTTSAKFIAKIAKERNIKMVHISTDHLFQGTDQYVQENHEVDPLNVYGITKANAEKAILEINPDALIVRTNFYGWGPSYRKSFSDIIIETLRKGNTINLFNDVYYTPIVIEKLVEYINDLLAKQAMGIYHVVADERVSKFQFGMKLAQIFGLDASLIRESSLVNAPNLVRRPLDMSLSNEKAAAKIGRSLGTIEEHLQHLLNQEKTGIINEIISL